MAPSWRVEILPFLDQSKYKKDEPWDSENNKKVLAQMPSIFRHPSQAADSTNAAIVAAYGKGLVFEENDTDGTKISEILDGTSNTIGVYEAKTEIPWTKPEEPVIDLAGSKLPDLSGFDGIGLNMSTADGTVRYVSKLIDQEVLKKLFTKAGGEALLRHCGTEASPGAIVVASPSSAPQGQPQTSLGAARPAGAPPQVVGFKRSQP